MTAAFLFLLSLLSVLSTSLSQPPRDVRIDCGATEISTINDIEWLPDTGYVSSGTPKNVTTQVLNRTLATARTFPLKNNLFKKFCYEIPVDRTRKYMVRTTYFYGGIGGYIHTRPPVFDQIVDGTTWSMVNTTEYYMNGDSTYYEGIFKPTGKNLSVCLAANTHTDSDPFISALEVLILWDQMYNSTDFNTYALSLVARHGFGLGGMGIRYPDDLFDRYWAPFGESNSPALSSENVSVSGIWNLPPVRVFQTRLTKDQPEPLVLIWPPASLPNCSYYIALYFADDLVSVSSRMLDITINGITYYNNLSVTPAGVVVFGNFIEKDFLTRQHLEDNGLHGQIPPSLGNLKNLRELHLLSHSKNAHVTIYSHMHYVYIFGNGHRCGNRILVPSLAMGSDMNSFPCLRREIVFTQ
ncbi:uncharacterized protein At1g24485-like [Olea europaea var. sylvestris]|uniref:uncharacterized protein At1g24485-like n=1 Tax=Olea europaea var. sylvestris TaxID=158386 RepID=UPI000C1D0D94|nr:uncharacterized protein At1g24485-like [Olea europaea var. sylvestris]